MLCVGVDLGVCGGGVRIGGGWKCVGVSACLCVCREVKTSGGEGTPESHPTCPIQDEL